MLKLVYRKAFKREMPQGHHRTLPYEGELLIVEGWRDIRNTVKTASANEIQDLCFSPLHFLSCLSSLPLATNTEWGPSFQLKTFILDFQINLL